MTDTATDPLGAITEGLKVWADVGVTLGKSVDRQGEEVAKLRRRLEAFTPVDYSPIGDVVFPAAGVGVLDLGRPDSGTYWEVHGVSIGGTEMTTAAAGSAGLYVSGYVPPTGGAHSPGTAYLRDQTATLPNNAFYGTRQMIVHDAEHLFFVLFGGTAGQLYVANAQVAVFRVDSSLGRDVTVS